MRVATLTTWNENGLARASRIRGLDSGLRRNDGWWWRGIGDGQPQGLPLREVGRACFLRNDRLPFELCKISLGVMPLCYNNLVSANVAQW